MEYYGLSGTFREAYIQVFRCEEFSADQHDVGTVKNKIISSVPTQLNTNALASLNIRNNVDFRLLPRANDGILALRQL